MENQISEKIYHAAIYLRLSDDDGASGESDSISNQRLLIQGYLAGKQEFAVVRECVDDGFTGTNFERPGFQEMMGLAQNGKVNCIIAKDLSRFGRDFSGVLQYVERILPRMGVRLILVNDHYDSLLPNHDLITIRMKSFINDIYPADTSRSVRANLLAKMLDGQCVAAFAFYGYLKSPEDKHKLVADPVAGAVVQDIFHLKLKGYSLSAIAGVLNTRGILPPLAYKQIFLKQKFTIGFKTNGKNLWDASMIRRILLDERYTGVLLQGRTTTPNYKVKRVIHKSEDEWVRVQDAFEPLVDKHTYQVVLHLMGRDARKSAFGPALLGGLVECADCRRGMVRKSPDGRNRYFVCSTSLYEKECSPHSFNEEKLVEAVKESIRYYISVIVELESALAYVKTVSLPEQKMFGADQKLKALEQEIGRIMQIKKRVYESYCEGLLDEEEFHAYKKKYDMELKQKEQAVERQRSDISDMLSAVDRQMEWMEHFLVYKDTQEIDRVMLAMLVKRVLIHKDKKITVEFWFGDEFERLAALLQTVNRIQPDRALEAFLEMEGGTVGA